MHKSIIKILRFTKKLVLIVVSALNKFIPKKNFILFYNDSIRDNNKYLLEYVTNNTNLDVICYCTDGKKDINLKRKIRYISGVFPLYTSLLRCKVMVTSFDNRFIIVPAKTQTFIQLWHGYALKRIGNDIVKSKWDRRGSYYTELLCYSDFWKSNLCSAFGIKETQLRIWDNPRNDLLYDPISKEDIKVMLKLSDYNKLLLWMPTYRKSHLLRNSIDSLTDIPVINSNNINYINSYLAKANNILIIKPHPLQNSLKTIISDCSNIFLIDNEFIENNGFELYHLLGTADALITDYSSVYFDYLKLNRPIAFVFDDYQDYKKRRGFAFNNIESLMPGPIIGDMNGLCDFLSDPSQFDDSYIFARECVRNKISFWNDNNNCKRISDHIVDLVSKK